MFEPRAEVIAAYAGINEQERKVGQDVILAMLKRRPCTAQDVAAAFSLDLAKTKKLLNKMTDEQLVRIESRNGDEYFIGRE